MAATTWEVGHSREIQQAGNLRRGRGGNGRREDKAEFGFRLSRYRPETRLTAGRVALGDVPIMRYNMS